MTQHQQTGETIALVAKTYVFSVGGAAFLGFGLQQWVLASALALACCQLIHWGWRFYTWLRFDRGHRKPPGQL